MPKIRKSAKRFVEKKEVEQKTEARVESKEVLPELSTVIEMTEEDFVKDMETIQGFVDTQPELRLTKDEMKELQLMNAFIRCYNAEKELTTMKRDDFLKMVDPANQIRRFAGTIQHLEAELHNTKLLQNKLVESIKSRLGIDIAKYTYNEDSGILTEVGE